MMNVVKTGFSRRALFLFVCVVFGNGCSLTGLDEGLQADLCDPQDVHSCDALEDSLPLEDECLQWRCDVDSHCRPLLRDRDYDGHVDALCAGEHETSDCNDEQADIFPGAGETCDGQDNDCDDVIDEEALTVGSAVRLETGVQRSTSVSFGFSSETDQALMSFESGQQIRGRSLDLSGSPDIQNIPTEEISVWDCGMAMHHVQGDRWVHGWVERDAMDGAAPGSFWVASAFTGDPSALVVEAEDQRWQMMQNDACTKPHAPQISVSSGSLLSAFLCVSSDSAVSQNRLCSPDLGALPACEQRVDDRVVALGLGNFNDADFRVQGVVEEPVVVGQTYDPAPPAILEVAENVWLLAYLSDDEGGVVIKEVRRVQDTLQVSEDPLYVEPLTTGAEVGLVLKSLHEDHTVFGLTVRHGCVVQEQVMLRSLTWSDEMAGAVIEQGQIWVSETMASGRRQWPEALWLDHVGQWLVVFQDTSNQGQGNESHLIGIRLNESLEPVGEVDGVSLAMFLQENRDEKRWSVFAKQDTRSLHLLVHQEGAQEDMVNIVPLSCF